MLFGRSKHHLECMTADFLPFEETLHIIVADSDMNLQVLQFDPDRTSSFHLPQIILTIDV
jgi:cleavage and polyadenylation specificity factor subunit 1